MTDAVRSGRLEISLLILEDDIRLHLNSAQASLDTQQVKYARGGLLSAAIVSAYAKLALTHAQFTDHKERDRFHEYMGLAVKLINAYWSDFGLTLLKQVGGGEQTVAQVKPKEQPSKPAIIQRRPKVFLSAQQKAQIRTLWGERPADVTVSQWQGEIAAQFHCHPNTVYKIASGYRNGH